MTRFPWAFFGSGMHPHRVTAAAFLVFLAVAAGLQWAGGAYRCEFSTDPDEPAHYVTGLMVRDYVAAGLPAHPAAYAKCYYEHYPKVALGHWPPFFYVVQAAWMLLFSCSRESVLMLLAVLSALLATLQFSVVRREWGTFPAGVSSLVTLSVPLNQWVGRAVMADILVALLALAALICYARYLDSGDWRPAAGFGLWSSLAILTKGTALALALVPVFSMLLSARWRLVRQWPFWLPAAMVALLCGPWFILAPDARHESVMPYGGLRLARGLFWRLPGRYLYSAGTVLSVLAAAGILFCLYRSLRPARVASLWSTMAAWVFAASSLYAVSLVASDNRAITLVIPAIVILATAFLCRVFEWLRSHAGVPRLAGALAALAGAAVLLVHNVYALPPKVHSGYRELSLALLACPDFAGERFLVVADSFGEGMFISEIAMHEHRPGHTIHRGYKVLTVTNWTGNRYRLLYRTPDEALDALDRLHIGVVVIDSRFASVPHERVLMETIAARPERWKRWYPAQESNRSAGYLLTYQLIPAGG